jgi:glycosyltransferase involved in cell wall biosynthesis
LPRIQKEAGVKLVTNVYGTTPTGGVEMHVLQASRELARRGHEVDLLYVEPGSFEPEYRKFCRSVTRVPAVDYWYPQGRRDRPKAMLQMAPAVWAAARRRPDVIYGNRVFSNGWAVPAGRLARAPVVCHLHGHTDLSPDRMAFLNRHVDRFVIISQFVADEWLAAGLDPPKADVVFNGIDPAEYPFGGMEERTEARRILELPDDGFVVTYFGRVDREKGVHVLLEAWRRLSLDPKRSGLLVVGSSMVDHDEGAYQAELEALAADGVRFLPARRDVVVTLHAADVVVVPSTWDEPFGRTVIEGLSTGRPVVASRVGGIPEILEGPFERFLFERGDVEGLVERLRSLVRWREDEPELGTLCQSRVHQGFTLAQMVDGIEDAFRAVT